MLFCGAVFAKGLGIAEARRAVGVYVVLAWMIVNVILFALMIPSDAEDLNNYVEVALWVSSIAGLSLNKRWGFAFAISVLSITLGTSMRNVFLAYHTETLQLLFAPVNALCIMVHVVVIVYLFRFCFAANSAEKAY